MQQRTNLPTLLGKSSILKLSLHGIRGVLERELGVDNLIYATDETVRGEILRRQKGQEVLPSKFAWANILGVTGSKDRSGAPKNIGRFGYRSGTSNSSRNTTSKGFLFPIDLGIELHYVNSDPDAVLRMCETFAILSLTDGLSFTITVGDFEWETSIEIPLDFSIPIAQNNDSSNPMAQEITVNLIAHTKAGFFRDSAAVTTAAPTMNTSMKIAGSENSFLDIGSFNLDFDSMGDK